jgi:peptide/nickel transport system ATP-binding protein/oligopeptide transport system ATP-binding protein
MPLLNVENLRAGFSSPDGFIPAVTDVSFTIEPGESVALVGESGCGKSVSAMSILRLLDSPPAVIEADEISFNGTDILKLPGDKLREIRGNEITIIFQEPMTSLNPLIPVGRQIAESVSLHHGLNKRSAQQYAVDMLRKVKIPDPEQRAKNYPHQMSGGMRQRVMIAMALACKPKLLIADEPTTALDVTIQAQILDLIAEMQREIGMALLLITHNLGIVSEYADTILVMYAGQILEKADKDTLLDCPAHFYTRGLMDTIPTGQKQDGELFVINGTVPSPMFYSKACRFAPRCRHARAECKERAPALTDIGQGHMVRCHYPLIAGKEE